MIPQSQSVSKGTSTKVSTWACRAHRRCSSTASSCRPCRHMTISPLASTQRWPNDINGSTRCPRRHWYTSDCRLGPESVLPLCRRMDSHCRRRSRLGGVSDTDYREVSASRGSLISPFLQHQPRPQLWIGYELRSEAHTSEIQ